MTETMQELINPILKEYLDFECETFYVEILPGGTVNKVVLYGPYPKAEKEEVREEESNKLVDGV